MYPPDISKDFTFLIKMLEEKNIYKHEFLYKFKIMKDFEACASAIKGKEVGYTH